MSSEGYAVPISLNTKERIIVSMANANGAQPESSKGGADHRRGSLWDRGNYFRWLCVLRNKDRSNLRDSNRNTALSAEASSLVDLRPTFFAS